VLTPALPEVIVKVTKLLLPGAIGVLEGMLVTTAIVTLEVLVSRVTAR
jgi:hypothetical protein